MLQICLDLIKHLDHKIEALDNEIFNYAHRKNELKMSILMSVSCIEEIDAITLIAGISNLRIFIK